VQDSENNGGPSQFERNSLPLNAAVTIWLTPRAIDGRPKGNGPRPNTLTGAVTYDSNGKRIMIPTPTARLGEPRGPQAKRYFDPARSNDLDDYVAATGTPGQLNPEWVEWLMGYPAGWTASED